MLESEEENSEDEDKNPGNSASVPNLNNGKSPYNKRRGLSETPEIQRKSRKLFAARTRDIDKLESDKAMGRKRSLTNPRSSMDETESSRKSSISSGNRTRDKSKDKQFAVTLLVSESDKTKIMDMLIKAKSVISRKVEKVMGKKPSKAQISNADTLKTVLQNWVEEEESRELQESHEEDELIKAQEIQVDAMRTHGLSPPVQLRPIPTTMVSPVPEDDEVEEILEEENNDDIEVQEVFEGQTSLLLPPKACNKYKLPSLTTATPPMSPARSLTPCDTVPRPAFLRQMSEAADYKLRRPSSHYDASAQAASSRPASRQSTCVSPPVFDYSAFARAKAFQDQANHSIMHWEAMEEEEEVDDSGHRIQRPESMIIPIGGVWRPDDEPIEFFLDQANEKSSEEVSKVDGNSTSTSKGRARASFCFFINLMCQCLLLTNITCLFSHGPNPKVDDHKWDSTWESPQFIPN